MSAPDPVALARTLRAAERSPRKTIAQLQQARLDALVTHARERSPYYRRVLPRPLAGPSWRRCPRSIRPPSTSASTRSSAIRDCAATPWRLIWPAPTGISPIAGSSR